MKTHIVFKSIYFTIIFLLAVCNCNLLSAQKQTGTGSFYTAELKYLHAVYLIKGKFSVQGDGVADDAPALQEAINQVEKQTRSGIVFVPEGVYRLGSTVNIWKGIRLIGYGKKRPVFLLAANTSGFQSGDGKYMVRFCDRRTPSHMPVIDGTPGTLFSGISNIDFTIEAGNPAAVAIRFHVAQHSFLEHIDFNIGKALGAVEEIGNEITDCRFFGGEWAIGTGLPAAGWQSMLLDCSFEGQRKWAIQSKDAGLTMLRCQFRNLAAGIKVLQGNNERLFIKDTWFENIGEPAIGIGNYYDPRTQVTLQNLKFRNVPISINFELLPGVITPISRDSLRRKADGPMYRIEYLSHGLHIDVDGAGQAQRRFVTNSRHAAISSMGDFPATDIPRPEDLSAWVNVQSLGAKGDGITDDTKIFAGAIEKYQTIFIPEGKYYISEPLVLREKTAIVGLHPLQTMLILKDSMKLFSDTTKPRPMVIVPAGGRNIVTGIGIDPGYNPGAIAIKWMAGEHSYLNDVHIPSRRSSVKGTGQYYGIWVTNGGGGVFKASWFPNELARNGFFVNNTRTKGTVYLLSVEHHKSVELQLDNVANWTFYSLQTEEDQGSDQTVAASIDNCHEIRFVNQYCYRRALMPGPFISAFTITRSDQIIVSGMHSFSSGPFPYDNAVYIEDAKIRVPQSEFSQFTLR